MNNMMTAFFIFIALSAAAATAKERDNDTGDCLTDYKFQARPSCFYNFTECDVGCVIGECLSCDLSLCEVVQGTCLIDFNENSTIEANLRSGNLYSKLPWPPKSCAELTDRMCGPMNREGLFCSQCRPGYGPAPYSSTVKCFECKDDGSVRLWVMYLALEIVPSTLFYLFVIFFNVRTTAPPVTAFMFFSQFFVLLYKVQPYIRTSLNTGVNNVFLKGVLTLVGFWNLDFFRHIIRPFCVSSSFTDLDVLLLEFVSCLYPLFLVLLTFICIELHSRNFIPLVLLWKPIHKHLVSCRRKLDPRSSVIAAFATFMTLSFSKIMIVSFLSAMPGSYSIALTMPQIKTIGLYNPDIFTNTSAEYWKQLLVTPYLFPLVFIFALVHILPIFLLLYPTRRFRKLLMCCGSTRYHAISVFMDTFQGHYKDGTNGSRDYRAASSISFLLRTLFCGLLSTSHFQKGIPTRNLDRYLMLTYFLVIVSLFYGVIQPCKNKYMNIIESVVYGAGGLILLSIGSAHVQYVASESRYHSLKHNFGIYAGLYLSLTFLVLPSLVLLVSIFSKVFFRCCCSRKSQLVSKLQPMLSYFMQDESQIEELPELDYSHNNYQSLDTR